VNFRQSKSTCWIWILLWNFIHLLKICKYGMRIQLPYPSNVKYRVTLNQCIQCIKNYILSTNFMKILSIREQFFKMFKTLVQIWIFNQIHLLKQSVSVSVSNQATSYNSTDFEIEFSTLQKWQTRKNKNHWTEGYPYKF
jgi:hypothetical protein